MRDPGTSRRNPLFAHDDGIDDATDGADDADGARAAGPALDDVLAPGSTAETIITALAEAGPEAAEHLLKAAQELLLAAKAVVDAAERAVEARQQRDSPPDGSRSEPPSNVRRIDLA